MNRSETLNLLELASRVRSVERSVGESVGEIIAEALGRAERVQASFNAFVAIHHAAACERAALLDRQGDSGAPAGPLYGIPVVVKDNIDEAGVACSAGCRAYLDRIPERDAPVVVRLRAAGAVVVGRANMHELADGVTSDNPHFGPVHNPWRHGLHPGGSSGGSAVAVATGCVPAALGTDTGGSVRIPASLCGVVGLKPSAGLVPTTGVVPLSTTLDHVGPLTRSVPDAALMLEVLAGLEDGEFSAACHRDPRGLRVGVLDGFGFEADPPVAALFEEALRRLSQLGCSLRPVRLDRLARSLALLVRIYQPEAARYHAERLRERPDDFGEAVRQDLERGLRADPGRREAALAERTELTAAVAGGLADVDLFVCPTTPHPAGAIGAHASHTYLLFTCPFNLTGQPALSVPMGLVDGLPVGLQIIGPAGGDATVLRLGAAFERLVVAPRIPGW